MDIQTLLPFFSGIMALGVICGAVWFTVQQAINPIKTEIEHLKKEVEDIKTTRSKDELTFTKKLDDILSELKDIRKDMANNYMSRRDCDLMKNGCQKDIAEIKKKIEGL